MREIGNVQDSNATHAIAADPVAHALRAAVDAPVRRLTREEEQVPVHGHVVLLLGAELNVDEPRMDGIRDVPDLEAAEVPLDDVMTAECQVRVHVVEIAWLRRDEVFGWRARRDQPQVPRGLGGIHPTGAQSHPRIG